MLIVVDLINEIVFICLCVYSVFIIFLLLCMMFSIFGGILVFNVSLMSCMVESGFCFEGLSMNVLLYMMVIGNIYSGIMVGKLNGVMFVYMLIGWCSV